jgi:hypothetical protein
LYRVWPAEHWDLYKYTPTFALFFGLFAAFSDLWGLIGWNLLNAAVLAAGVLNLQGLKKREQALGLLFLWPELLISVQNEQSNALIAGLLLLSLGGLERGQQFRPAFWIVCSVFIKLFGVMALAVVPFYGRWHLTLFKAALVGIVLAALPMLVVSYDYYQAMLLSYVRMLSQDHSVSYGMSVMGWLQAWLGSIFSIQIPKSPVVFVGLLLLIAPAAQICIAGLRQQALFGAWWREGIASSSSYRALWMSSLIIWMVIFNHKAESPTFIIALSGILLAYFHGPRTKWDRTLLIVCWILSSWSPGDLFPTSLRREWVEPYQLKVFPYILYWLRILWLMWSTKIPAESTYSTLDLP